MKGLLKRIVGATLGLAMAIGVSVGAASNREARPVYATDLEATFAATNTTALQNQEGDITSKVGLSSPFTATLEKNGAGNSMYIKKNDFRMYGTAGTYKGNYLTISVSSSYSIKSFSFGGTTTLTTAQVFKGAISVSSNQVTGTSATLSAGTYTINDTQFTIYNNNKSIEGNNVQVKFGSISIAYVESGNSDVIEVTNIDVTGITNNSTISNASYGDTRNLTATVTYDDSEGHVAGDGSVAWSSNHEDRATVSEEGVVTFVGNGEVTITATSTDDSNNPPASGSVTFTLENIVVPVVTYTITYDDNGATSGSVPASPAEYEENQTVTVLGNVNSLAKTGYVWGGWNTAANGSGIDYSAGATFSASANVTLYARWFSNHSNDNNIIITASYLNLTSTATTSTTVLKATDGMRYMVSSGAKYTGVSGDNKFDGGSNSVILIGTTDAFLYNNDAFQKDIYKIELFSNDGASTAVKVAVNFGTSVCSDSYSEEETTLETDDTRYAFSPDIEHARYFRVQVTNNKNAQVQIKVYFVTPTTSVTVSPASVTLAPKATKQLTTTVLPVDRTDSLTYSTSDADVATVSAAGLITAKAVGTARITATSGSYSAYCDVTVETIPVITPASYSASGYTGGDDEVIGITYADLKGILGVATENDNVEAVIQNNDGEGHAEVKISFEKAGDCDVYLKDGSTTLATIEVSVTASIVTITNMPVSRAVRVGATLNLGSLITVTPTGSCSSAVTWSSSASGVATVTQAGVVTAVSNGSAIITVTPNDYHDGAVTCSILVAQAVSANFGTTDYDGSAVTTDSAIKEISGYVIDSNFKFSSLSNCYASANNSMKFGTSSKKASFTVGLNDNKVDGKLAFITRIVVTAKKYGTDSTTINIAGEGKELTASFAEYSVDFDNHTTTSVDIEASAASSQRFRISCISLYYEFLAKEVVKESDTLASLAYNYTQTGPNAYTFSKTSIRFGGFMDKTLWDRLDDESEIQGYGVLVSTDTYLGAESFEEWYEFFDGEIVGDHTQKDVIDELIDGNHIKGFYTAVPGGKEHPAEATTDQKAYMGVDAGDDYYVWTYRKNVAEADLTTDYVGVAFIVIDGDIVFLQQTTASAQSLAQDLIDNTDCTAASYDGSLGYLAGL